jgi:hypothetical protein
MRGAEKSQGENRRRGKQGNPKGVAAEQAGSLGEHYPVWAIQGNTMNIPCIPNEAERLQKKTDNNRM